MESAPELWVYRDPHPSRLILTSTNNGFIMPNIHTPHMYRAIERGTQFRIWDINVPAMHHHGVHQTLHNGTQSFSKTLLLVTPSGVWCENTGLALDGDAVHLNEILAGQT